MNYDWIDSIQFNISDHALNQLIYPLSFKICSEVTYTYQTCFHLFYMIEGSAFLSYQNKTYYLNQGDGCLLDGRYAYNFYSKEAYRCTHLAFNGKPATPLVEAYLADGNVKFTYEAFSNFEPLQLHMLQCVNKSSTYKEYEVSCTFYLLLTNLLIAKSHARNTSEDIEKIISYIQANYMNHLTIDHLSHTFGMSKTHITRCFKKYTGLTPHQYITQIRIYNAKHLLKTTHLSLDEISLQTGFCDAVYFIQVFKKIEGISPSKFRK